MHVDFDGARERDVIRVEYENENGTPGTRYSLVNASVGITAEANARFNDPSWLVRLARHLSVDAAITAAVLATLAAWRDVTCALSIDGGEPEMVSVTNLGVFKNPHFGGSLCYDTSVSADDGLLGAALCEGMTAFEAVHTSRRITEVPFRRGARRRGRGRQPAFPSKETACSRSRPTERSCGRGTRSSGSPNGDCCAVSRTGKSGPGRGYQTASAGRRGAGRTGCRT